MVAGLSPKRGGAQVTILTLKCEADVAEARWVFRLKSWTEASYDWTKTTAESCYG